MSEQSRAGLARIVIAALLAYAVLHCCAVGHAYKEAEEARRALRSEVQALRQERDERMRALESEPDDREIEKLARERLGLVMPNETIFSFSEAKDKEG